MSGELGDEASPGQGVVAKLQLCVLKQNSGSRLCQRPTGGPGDDANPGQGCKALTHLFSRFH